MNAFHSNLRQKADTTLAHTSVSRLTKLSQISLSSLLNKHLFWSTSKFALPYRLLTLINLLKQVRSVPNLMAWQNISHPPLIRHSKSRRVHLLINRIARRRHKRRKQRRQQVNRIQRRAQRRSTSVWEIIEQVVIEFILLKQKVNPRRHRHRRMQPILQP